MIIIAIISLISPKSVLKIQFHNQIRIYEVNLTCNFKTVTGTLISSKSPPQPFPVFVMMENDSILDVAKRLNPVGFFVFDGFDGRICSQMKNIPIVYFAPKEKRHFVDLVDRVNVTLYNEMKNYHNYTLKDYTFRYLLPLFVIATLLILLKAFGHRLFPLEKISFYFKNRATLKKLNNQINFFPIEKYKDKCKDLFCAICQCEVLEEEIVRTLPCSHQFHSTCIDPWLVYKKNCPMCQKRFFDNTKSSESSS